jgi:hypothetical protein
MKRFLNKLRTFTVSPQAGKTHVYQVSSGTPEDNELFIGKNSSEVTVGVFLNKSGQIYNLAYDDFAMEFLSVENARLNGAYDALIASLPTGTVPEMPEEEGA